MNEAVTVGVSDLVALVNQSFDYAFPTITVVGELANLRVSKNRWVYFDLKDDGATVKFFGTVYQLPGPLEDGMLLSVDATPRLHNLYGFSMNVQAMRPTGEGSIRKAADLLRAKLEAEGLFDVERKRLLPYPPTRIGLITSRQSAAYADFIKIINARWGGVTIILADVQVQGEPAPGQVSSAIERFNAQAMPPDVLVVIRGGGSAEDLAAFSTEQVTRAVAASRVPTIVAIGHEIDVSLAELAADQRASTPSNAAELLVPDKQEVIRNIEQRRQALRQVLHAIVADHGRAVKAYREQLEGAVQRIIDNARRELHAKRSIITAYDPALALKRGYAIVRHDQQPVTNKNSLTAGDSITVELHDGLIDARVE